MIPDKPGYWWYWTDLGWKPLRVYMRGDGILALSGSVTPIGHFDPWRWGGPCTPPEGRPDGK